jgi:erythronate-4-phosphate dehydrogenase
MKSLILIDENIPLLAEALKPVLGATWQAQTYSGRYVPVDKLAQCEALFVRSVTRVDESLLAGTSVVFVGTATSGLEHVDTDYLRRHNIHFVDAPGCNSNSVAEYVTFAALEWADMQAGGTLVENAPDTRADENTLVGKTMGIVGYGHIGKKVAAYARKLGMTVLVSDPPLSERKYVFGENVESVSLEELLERSDVVTNHVPFKREGRDGAHPTVGLFGEREFARMRHGALFVHTSRRFVALEAELLPFLREGRLHAAIDVWEQEPKINKELASLAMLATPHIAGYSFEGKLRGSVMMAERFAEFFGVQPDMSVFERALAYPDKPHVDYARQQDVYDALRTSRRLDEDTDALRETLSAEDFQHVALFDKLRKNYPKRREILVP